MLVNPALMTVKVASMALHVTHVARIIFLVPQNVFRAQSPAILLIEIVAILVLKTVLIVT